MAAFPKYAELKRPDATGLPLSWGVWGAEDQVGTLNHITPERVAAAARLVKRGVRFNLDLPLHVPHGIIKPKAHYRRGAPVPTLFERNDADSWGRDDKLDGFFLQASSQWDGLTHYGTPGRFYNDTAPEHVTHGENSRLGIDRVAQFGLAGRGVLADIPRYFAKVGRDWDPMAQQVVSPADLEACLGDAGVSLEPGDILMVRMGWVGALLGEPELEKRDRLFRAATYSGLSGQEDMWEYLWNRQVAAVATDTVTVEVWPRAVDGCSMHLAIARLGLTIGEMFDFEALAADSAATGEYLALFTSSPLNLRGGVGSPPNAMVLR